MDITEVSKRSGIPASTLRYYEEKGLIKSIGRNGIRRVFDSDIIDKLELIVLGKSSGFSLDEILTIFTPRGIPKIDRKLFVDKANEIDRQIKNLTAVRDGLRHVATRPEGNHLECPKFRRLMRIASKKAARRTTKNTSNPSSSNTENIRRNFKR